HLRRQGEIDERRDQQTPSHPEGKGGRGTRRALRPDPPGCLDIASDGLSKNPELRDTEAVRRHVGPLRSPRSCAHWEELTLLEPWATKTVSKNRTTRDRARKGLPKQKGKNYRVLERRIRGAEARPTALLTAEN